MVNADALTHILSQGASDVYADHGNVAFMLSLISRFMGPIWGPSGADRTHVGPMWAPWTLLSGMTFWRTYNLNTSTLYKCCYIFSVKDMARLWLLMAWGILRAMASAKAAFVLRPLPLHWRHNEHDGVSNHQPHDCLLNGLFRCRSKENIKAPCHWPLGGEFTGDQ